MRLEITRRAELAVRAMAALGAAPERMKASDLAVLVGTTTAFVSQVVGPLVKAGWVQSEPGPLGGYSLHVRLEDVSVLAVIEAIDGPTDNGRCVVEDGSCNAQMPCVLHVAWSRARSELLRTLDSTPLTSLL